MFLWIRRVRESHSDTDDYCYVIREIVDRCRVWESHSDADDRCYMIREIVDRYRVWESHSDSDDRCYVKPTLTGWSNRWTWSWRLVLPLRWGWLNLRRCCRSCFGVYWHRHYRLVWRPWRWRRCWNACYCWHWRPHLGRQSKLEKQGRCVCCSRNANVGSAVESYLDS